MVPDSKRRVYIMEKKPLFEFDMSASSDKKRRNKGRKASTGAVDTSRKECEKEGCNKSGKYRAPKAADNNSEFYWFCREHVREYNLTWNFFENHTPKQFQDQVDADKTWDRKTKPFRDQGREAEQMTLQMFQVKKAPGKKYAVQFIQNAQELQKDAPLKSQKPKIV